MKKLKVGIVGLQFGSSWAKTFSLYSKCKLVAVCDFDKQKAETVAIGDGTEKALTNYEDLLKLDLDIIGVFTPGPLHAKHAIAAMEAGKHVLCAVPTALTLEECKELISAVERTGMKYMLAETMCYHPVVTYVKEMYEAGEMGDIFYYQGAYFHDLGGPGSGHDYFSHEMQPDGLNPDEKYTWRYGWPPFYYPEHNSAPIIWVLGQRMTEVTAYGCGSDIEDFEEKYGARWSAQYNNPYTFEVGLFCMEGGALAKISICWVLAGDWWETQYFGTRRSYVEGPIPLEKDILMKKNERTVPVDRLTYKERLDPSLQRRVGSEASPFIVQEFVRSVLSDTTPPVDVYKAVSFTVSGLCAHQSALEHRTVTIPDFGKITR